MIATLRNGLRLSLAEGTPVEVVRVPGNWFILDGTPCAIPDLAITPAFVATCQNLSDIWELHQREVILGKTEDVEEIA